MIPHIFGRKNTSKDKDMQQIHNNFLEKLNMDMLSIYRDHFMDMINSVGYTPDIVKRCNYDKELFAAQLIDILDKYFGFIIHRDLHISNKLTNHRKLEIIKDLLPDIKNKYNNNTNERDARALHLGQQQLKNQYTFNDSYIEDVANLFRRSISDAISDMIDYVLSIVHGDDYKNMYGGFEGVAIYVSLSTKEDKFASSNSYKIFSTFIENRLDIKPNRGKMRRFIDHLTSCTNRYELLYVIVDMYFNNGAYVLEDICKRADKLIAKDLFRSSDLIDNFICSYDQFYGMVVENKIVNNTIWEVQFKNLKYIHLFSEDEFVRQDVADPTITITNQRPIYNIETLKLIDQMIGTTKSLSNTMSRYCLRAIEMFKKDELQKIYNECKVIPLSQRFLHNLVNHLKHKFIMFTGYMNVINFDIVKKVIQLVWNEQDYRSHKRKFLSLSNYTLQDLNDDNLLTKINGISDIILNDNKYLVDSRGRIHINITFAINTSHMLKINPKISIDNYLIFIETSCIFGYKVKDCKCTIVYSNNEQHRSSSIKERIESLIAQYLSDVYPYIAQALILVDHIYKKVSATSGMEEQGIIYRGNVMDLFAEINYYNSDLYDSSSKALTVGPCKYRYDRNGKVTITASQ